MSEVIRRRNGLPKARKKGVKWYKLLLTSPWTWTTLFATAIFAFCLYDQYLLITADIEVPGGSVPGINWISLRQATNYALPTLGFWVLIYLIADRFRPQRLLVWYLALGWGASVSIFLSMYINTWAAGHLSIAGDGDPATGARAAIFIAPFVEEAAKATILFWLAILVRYRLVSKVSLVVLGGLSAVGFAFVENIVYYSRAIFFATHTIEVGDAATAISEVVWMRGFWTCFGHPLFTTLTAIGVAVSLRTRSKVVRVIAPLVGYLAAAFGHMVFNSQATLTEGVAQLFVYWAIAIPLLIAVVVFVIRQVFIQGWLIRNRLTDYVRMGWLQESDPMAFGRLRSRFAAVLIALSYGLTSWLATLRLQRTMTELAYLRDAEVRGLIDAPETRAKELLYLIRELRDVAVSDPRGLRLRLPRWRKSKPKTDWPQPSGQLSPQSGYSYVDPTWGPPS